ncbi:hypothetical protein [Dietzia cercidiphylli]|uniref:hypothetical protein n=1 Tax=Dietzia cercidiphylli TaxID=498199 RepID=UPI003CD05E75
MVVTLVVVLVVVLVVGIVRLAAPVLHTRPQRREQIGHLVVAVIVRRLLLLHRERLTAGRLGLDQLRELILVVVLILLGLEVRRHGLDERRRHLDLLRPDLGLLVQPLQNRRADLVRPQQRLQHQDVLEDPERTQASAVAQRERADGRRSTSSPS